jgi:hypothetical protein
MATLENFELFPELPQEIQEAIWELALPPVRLVGLVEEILDPFAECGDFQYYMDLHGYKKYCEFQDLNIHADLEAHENVYGHDDYVHDQALSHRAVTRNKTYWEDTRSVPESDLLMLVHLYAHGPEGCLKRQMQLNDYGFTSSHAAPIIGHAVNYDVASYQGHGESGDKHISFDRDVRSLIHASEYGEKRQQQLLRYGFASSRPVPAIRHLSWLHHIRETRKKRYYDFSEPPAILQVCRGSRRVARRYGFASAFATLCSPAETWYNFNKDFLYLEPDAGWTMNEFQLEDRRRVRRLVVDFFYDQWEIAPNDNEFEHPGLLVQQFENLEELVILVVNKNKCQMSSLDADDWMFVDCTEAEVLGPTTEFSPPKIYDLWSSITHYNDYHYAGIPFFEYLAHSVEVSLTKHRETTLQTGDPVWKIPAVRFAILTDARGNERLQSIREEYWTEIQVQSLFDDSGSEILCE